MFQLRHVPELQVTYAPDSRQQIGEEKLPEIESCND